MTYPCRYRGCADRTSRVWRARNGRRRIAAMLCDAHADLCDRVATEPRLVIRIRYAEGIPEVWIEPILVVQTSYERRPSAVEG